MREQRMKTESKFTCLGCWLIFSTLLIVGSDCQYRGPACTEFASPQKIEVEKNGVSSTIKFPEFQIRYKPEQVCEWRISAQTKGYVIKLNVVRCEMQGRDLYGECNNDYVDVFDSQDGKTKFINRFCDVDIGQMFESSGSQMILRFHSDTSYEFGGFEVSYWEEQPEEKEAEGQSTIHLAVGISCAILAFCLLMTLSIVYVRIRRKQQVSGRRRSLRNATTEGRVAPQQSFQRNQGQGDASRFLNSANRGRFSNTTTDRYLPPPVVYPGPPLPPFPGQQISATPPPAYDLLGYEWAEPGVGGMPVTPPPYEEVVSKTEVDETTDQV